MIDLSLPSAIKGRMAEKHVYEKFLELGCEAYRYEHRDKHDIWANGHNIEVKAAFGHNERFNITHKGNDFYALVRWIELPITFIIPAKNMPEDSIYIKITYIKDFWKYYEAWDYILKA